MSLPKLRKLSLKFVYELPYPVQIIKQLSTLKIIENPGCKFNFESLYQAIIQMPDLSNLYFYEYFMIAEHIFCKDYIFKIINLVLSREKYVVITKYDFVNCQSFESFSQIEIFKNVHSERNNCRFKIAVDEECFGECVETYLKNSNLLMNCKVFIREIEDCNPLISES